MKVAISGSRGPDPSRGRMNGWTDIIFIERLLMKLSAAGASIIVGDAPSGVDYCVRLVAAKHDTISISDPYKANWNIEGRAAGSNRNKRMIADADKLIAIFADGPKSPGTSNAVMWANKKGIPVFAYHEGNWDGPVDRLTSPVLAGIMRKHEEE